MLTFGLLLNVIADFLALGDREELERHHAVAKMKAKINEIKKRAEEAQSLQWHVTTERSELTRPKRTDYFIDKEHTKLVSSSLPAPLSTFSTSLSEQLSLSINGQTPWHRNAWISKWYPSSNKGNFENKFFTFYEKNINTFIT